MTDTINSARHKYFRFSRPDLLVFRHIRPYDLTLNSRSRCVKTTPLIPPQALIRANHHCYYSQHPDSRLISSRAASNHTARTAYLPPRPTARPQFTRNHTIGSQRAFGIKSYRTWQMQPPVQSRAAVSSLCCLERQPLERCVAQDVILTHQSHSISDIDQTPASAVWLHRSFLYSLLPHHKFKRRRSSFEIHRDDMLITGTVFTSVALRKQRLSGE